MYTRSYMPSSSPSCIFTLCFLYPLIAKINWHLSHSTFESSHHLSGMSPATLRFFLTPDVFALVLLPAIPAGMTFLHLPHSGTTSNILAAVHSSHLHSCSPNLSLPSFGYIYTHTLVRSFANSPNFTLHVYGPNEISIRIIHSTTPESIRENLASIRQNFEKRLRNNNLFSFKCT